MTTTAPSSAASMLPGVNGECGYQHGMAPCLPMNGLECCSLNGFCGSNETYCLTEFGCQYGCVPPSYFTPNASTTVVVTSVLTTLSSNTAPSQSITKTSSITATSTKAVSSSTNSTVPAGQSSGLSSKAKAGVIAGSIVGFLVIALIVYIAWKRHQNAQKRNARFEADQRERQAAMAAMAAAAAAAAPAAPPPRPSVEHPQGLDGMIADHDLEVHNYGDRMSR